eukprot:gene8102-10973_t
MASVSTPKKDLIGAIRSYVDKIVSDGSMGGMKALLLDPITTKIVSMVYSQTQILEKEVYLIEMLGKPHESMSHLTAAIFIQPTEANFDLLVKEFHQPRFKEYHLFFSNILSQDMLARLARADEHDLVMQVQEYYADYLVVNEEFFHLGMDKSLSSTISRTLDSSQILDRNVNGILSILLSIKKKPTQIRYQQGSDTARRIASDVATNIEREDGLFDFRKQEGTLLLILDRKDDPITPLLSQWTYQAMVHELLGLKNNRVDLKDVPNVSKDLQEVVLSATQDDFFAKNRYANFGDLGTAVKQLLDDYQKTSKMNDNITSIADMQAFLERYPMFRSKSINVSKHVALMSELARQTDVRQLLDVSQLEQEIACSNEHSAHKAELLDKLRNPRLDFSDKLRLSILFLIRYESYNEARELKTLLSNAPNVNTKQLSLLDEVLDYAGESKRAPGLFSGGSGGIISKLTQTFNSSVNGVQNVYTQHQPLLSYTLESIAKGKLKDASFPMVSSFSGGGTNAKPSDIVVFIAGGATYEEATKVALFNSSNPGMRVVLGGSCIHNSKTFLKEIENAFSR